MQNRHCLQKTKCIKTYSFIPFWQAIVPQMPSCIPLKGPSAGLAILSWEAQCIHCMLTVMNTVNYIAMRRGKCSNFKLNIVLLLKGALLQDRGGDTPYQMLWYVASLTAMLSAWQPAWTNQVLPHQVDASWEGTSCWKSNSMHCMPQHWQVQRASHKQQLSPPEIMVSGYFKHINLYY